MSLEVCIINITKRGMAVNQRLANVGEFEYPESSDIEPVNLLINEDNA